MNKDQAKEIIKQGWYSLIDKAYAITDQLSFANITDVSIRHSMLQIIFAEPLDNTQKYVLDCVSYKIERESARMCEECGAYGVRRNNLEIKQCLCTSCYTLKYNEMVESASPQVTNQ